MLHVEFKKENIQTSILNIYKYFIQILTSYKIKIEISHSMFADKVNDIQTDIHNDMAEFFKTFTHIGDVHIT